MPIRRDGPITVGTRANLIQGVRSRPMPQPAVDAVMDQMSRFVEHVVDTYSTDVAAGEVGEGGSGQASDVPILADSPPKALLYGRVQSGKTVAMILATALCIDNGFRVVVVLTTDNVALVRQTASRFRDLDGPRVFSSNKEGANYEWEGQEEQLQEFVETDGLVLVCSKNAFGLPHLIRFLQRMDASGYPVLFLDDEADAATLDTTAAARALNRPNAPRHASTINRLVVFNDRIGDEGFSLSENLPHSVFVQVTATPFVLLLQCLGARLRPTTTFLLEPGDGYCGGEAFFAEFNEQPGGLQPNPIVIIPGNEATLIRREVPLGLSTSINFFIMSAAARGIRAGWPTEGFKHLSHPSHRISDHDLVCSHIETHLNDVRRILRADGPEAEEFFARAYDELQRSVGDLPPLTDVITAAAAAIRQVDVVRVNSEADIPQYGPRLNFVVGGNILGRGLTIDDLLVTYYIREAQTSQMDTVWQHARMYGYRSNYIDYMRIFLPHRLGLTFKRIHLAEEELRTALSAENAPNAVLIRVPRAARATRPNALDPTSVRALRGGTDQIFPHSIVHDVETAAGIQAELTRLGVPIGGVDRSDRAVQIPLGDALALISAVPIPEDDSGLWNADAMIALLQSYGDTMQGTCTVYVRGFAPGTTFDDGRTRGRLGGVEIQAIRREARGAPGLALIYMGDQSAPDAWFPTMVMPAGSPTYVFNTEYEDD